MTAPRSHEPQPAIPAPRTEHNVSSKVQVGWVDLPTPDAAIVVDHDGRIMVLADSRMDRERVERVRQAAELLAELVAEEGHGVN